MTSLNFIQKIILGLNLLFIFHLTNALAETPNQSNGITNAWELPPLILKDLNDQEHNLYDWHGKVILLNFWATWCGPCRVEIPDFIDLQARYADKGLQIIGVGLDEARKLRNFVRTVGINYPVLQANVESQYTLLKQWGNPFGILPFTVIIARDGHLVFMQHGVFNQQAFESIVKPLLYTKEGARNN